MREESIDKLVRRFGEKNTPIFLKALAQGKHFAQAIETPIGVELLSDATGRLESLTNKVINEEDVFPLHIIKNVCQIGKLISRRNKRFTVPKKSQLLLEDEKAGELYFHLFAIYFRRFDLSYCDGFPKLENIQGTFDYTFYIIGNLYN